MKDSFNKYGKRLTKEEYDARVVANFEANLDEYNKGNDQPYRRGEFDIAIDRHLGVNYPQGQRDALFNANERATKRFVANPATLLKSAFVAALQKKGLIGGMPPLDKGSASLGANFIAEEVTKEKTLATEDLIQFYGPEVAPAIRKMRGGQS